METLPRKLPSPAYVAMISLSPTVVDVRVHIPEAAVATQLSVPSLIVTSPVGIPPLMGVMLKVTR